MALQTTTPQAPLGAITTFRIVGLFETAVASFRAWRRARRTEKALFKLSDRQLNDVGIFRGQIVDVAEDLARG